MTVREVRVELGERSYPIVVGPGASRGIDRYLPSSARRAVIVTEESIPFRVDPNLPHETVVIEGGEASKTLATVESLARSFARSGLTRGDVIVAVGGGIVTDVAGFAAASWHRGTAYVNVPTTLLGMVDAAIGGKTAVNLPEGKNLVGAFWQPTAVLCDTDALSTLPEREMRCGLGEVAKYHFLSGRDLLADDLVARIAECAAIKAAIVSQDEREGGRRALLNYGHTLGHALESVGAHTLAHGEAVAVGILFAAELARDLDRIDQRRLDRHRHVIREEYGLVRPEHVAEIRSLDTGRLVEAMARDKKAVTGLTFVLDGERGVEVVPDLDPGVVAACLRRFQAELS